MLGKIRDQASSWYFKIFLTVIALSFVLWGVGEFATGSFDTTAITINGNKIPAQKVSKAYQTALSNMESRIGKELSDTNKKQLLIGERTISSIIRETLLNEYAHELGIRVSDEQLNATLRNMQTFKNSDGVFDRDIYRNTLLNQYDMTIEGFEKLIKEQLSRVYLNSIFDVRALNDKQTLETIAKTNKEKLDINILTISKNNIKNINKPTIAEQQAFYAESPNRWKTPELRSFKVLNISVADLAKNIITTEQELGDFYKNNMDNYNVPNKRQAQHILVKTEKEAKNIAIKIKSGEGFSKLAKAYSIDKFSAKKGGDLGSFSTTDMVKPFTDAAFSLKIGEVSDIVKSSFGYHIIKLTKTLPAYLKTFEQVRGEIKKELATNKAEKLYSQYIEEIEDSIAAGDNLEKISDNLKISISTFQDKTRWDGIVDTSLLAPVESTAIRNAFILPKGEISEKIDLADTNSIYVEVASITKQTQEPFNKIQSDLISTMINTETLKKLSEKAKKIYNNNKSGTSLQEISQNENLSNQYSTVENINRQLTNAPSWFKWSLASQLFNFPDAKHLSDPIYKGSTYHIVELAKRHSPEITNKMLEQEKMRLAVSIGNDIRLQYIQYLYKNADLSFNIPLLKQAMPGEVIKEERFIK